jgi:hypothetical protein
LQQVLQELVSVKPVLVKLVQLVLELVKLV